jgi:pentatricopeptide repeat protein
MPPRPFVNDALWRCLCPGFPVNASLPAIARVTCAPVLRTRPPKRTSVQQQRTYSQPFTSSPSNDAFFPQTSAPSFGSGDIVDPFPRREPGEKLPLARLPTRILYEHLRDAGAKGNFDEVLNICRVLMKDRGEPLNKDMYNGVLHSFVSVTNGTAGKARKVLDEMGFWEDDRDAFSGPAKIELDARGCECMLEVLAIHPDYLLRMEILDYMKSRWFTLSGRAQNFVVAGMLRERNFEQALETLEEMMRKKIRVESWLFDEAMWMLLEYGEVEEAFYVLNLKDSIQRNTADTGSAKLSHALWGALLDAAAQRQLVSEIYLL